DMAGSRVGTDAIADETIVSPDGEGFMVTPTEMPMQMHMLGAMFAPVDQVTLMAMLPYLSSDMDHLTRAGGTFTTESAGIGDVKISALVKLADVGRTRFIGTIGASLPTGSIEVMDVTPASDPNEVVLPYPMQIGSGTVDLIPSLTYLGQSDNFGWGVQARGTIRTGTNSRDYTLGNQFGGTTWGSVLVNNSLSLSTRLDVQTWGDIDGADASLNPMMVPTARTDLRGGTRADLSVGANVSLPDGNPLHGLRIAGEVATPLYQSLNGPQLETDLTFTLGAQFAF
ncbi:MAG: transporter, partial [Bacteroidota bacterium]